MKIKRRTFFGTILLAIGSIFVPRRAESVQVHTSGYLQTLGPGPCPSGPTGEAGKAAFSNRFLSRYEGRAIPSNVVFGQAVGSINKIPFHFQQEQVQTAKLKSVTKDL
jgi:hypothetical protein